MDSSEFIQSIKLYVRDAAVEDTILNLKRPPGRRVLPQERERADWYNKLSAADVSHVDSVIISAVHGALFGLFAVLDGDRAIEDGDAKGRFELSYVGKQRIVLNDPNNLGYTICSTQSIRNDNPYLHQSWTDSIRYEMSD
jgi:hypothetical protein